MLDTTPLSYRPKPRGYHGMPAAPDQIRSIVTTSVEQYARAFSQRHIKQKDKPKGTINQKIHNVFISEIGPEIKYYTALSRSLDSSLGSVIEKMALKIASISYTVI